MKYMVIETFKPGAVDAVYERFGAKGRMLPDGLEYLDAWVAKDRFRCFQLMETDDERLFDAWTEQWKDLVNFQIIPLQDSLSN